MRVPQRIGDKGSLKWIQVLVNENSDLLASALRPHLPARAAEAITWLSPLHEDDYAEYRDEGFLERMQIENLHVPLQDFWPANGPQWDALGRTSEQILLVEAKANVPEIISHCGATSDASLRRIKSSLKQTQAYLGGKCRMDWTSGFYQYANRLAHLYFLRELNRLDAYLIFIYFLHDDTHISTSRDEWAGALALQNNLMGLGRHRLHEYVVELFIDTRDLATA